MIAKKCDRCGKYYDEYNTENDERKINGFMFLNIDCREQYYTQDAHDLCQVCSKELVDWFFRKENKDD